MLDTEKQQLIIDENQPLQDALTTENDSLKLALEQAGIDATALLVQAGIEAEERDAADKLQNLIHAELHHRIKNMLATVGAITDQSLRTATSMTHARSAIDGRFAALARAHDLLTRVSWENATIEQHGSQRGRALRPGWRPLHHLRRGHPDHVQFGHRLRHDPERALHQHDKVRSPVSPGGAGASVLAVDGGRLQLEWVESGGPLVSEPTRKSFGTRMITSLGQQLKGQVELDYRPQGFVYRLDVPLLSLTSK